ncbi:MAG TPA: polyhydroxyalkanoic acid system family protein [Rhodanobacteraceae bacterium]|nr:polyhydroxyalkanoic acid system family protein [Rhodanobacteraceae bacterium]
MPDIDIHHPHSLGKRDCRTAVDAIARELSTRFGLGDLRWNGDTLAFTGHGVAGSLTVADGDAHVRVRLGPWLSLMRPAIEAGIRRQLHERLG